METVEPERVKRLRRGLVPAALVAVGLTTLISEASPGTGKSIGPQPDI
jgi:hypothetical protein